MGSKVNRAGEIFSQDGPISLLKEIGLYVLRNTSIGNGILLEQSKKQVRHRMNEEHDLEDVLDTVLEVQPGIRPYHVAALQLRNELHELVRFVAREQPTTVMEIGTANGGTLYTWCRCLPSVSDVISIDLPEGAFGGGYPEEKTEVFRSFASDKDLHFVRGNSHNENTFSIVQDDVLGSRTISDDVDFLFIDGDHSYEGVKQDFEMYKQVMADGGVIAFHDIVTHPDESSVVKRLQRANPDVGEEHFLWGSSHPDCTVDYFWDEVEDDYESVSFISHPSQTWGGIGVITL